MIGAWLLKILLAIAAVALVLVELGSPLVARAQADDAAHAVADNAAREIVQGHSEEEARAAAAEVATTRGVILDAFVVEAGTVRVTVSKEARSYVLRRVAAVRSWYHVDASAAAVTTIR